VVERLNSLGGSWIDVQAVPSNARTERGVDVVAKDSEVSELRFQVTRTEQAAWAELDRSGGPHSAAASLSQTSWAPASRIARTARAPSPSWRLTARMASSMTMTSNPRRRPSRAVSLTQ